MRTKLPIKASALIHLAVSDLKETDMDKLESAIEMFKEAGLVSKTTNLSPEQKLVGLISVAGAAIREHQDYLFFGEKPSYLKQLAAEKRLRAMKAAVDAGKSALRDAGRQ